MAIILNDNAILDLNSYSTFYGTEITEESDGVDRIKICINAISTIMERFCNRHLKAQDYSYLAVSENYDEEYSIFDGPEGSIFWFPTYPVNSLNTLIIGETTVTEATDYSATDGYHLYSATGKLIYFDGFEYGYPKNLFMVWNGGYAETHKSFDELQFICYDLVKSMLSVILHNSTIKSETIGTYSYTKFTVKEMKALQSLNPAVFSHLMRYRKEPIV